MWLNKAQMKEVYNISVECDAYPCKLSLSLELKDKIEINLGDAPYTYYVTEDNKEVEIVEYNPELYEEDIGNIDFEKDDIDIDKI